MFVATMEEIHEYIHGSNATNTGYSTNSSLNTLKRFMQATNDTRQPEIINPEELNIILCNFFMNVKRNDEKEFEPDSLSTIHRGISRYLASKNYSCDILVDDRFSETNKVSEED